MSIETCHKVIEKYLFWLSLPSIGPTDILEIIIISVVIYQLLSRVQNTRVWTLLKGVLMLLLFALFATLLQLNTISWILMNSLSVGITAALIIFQPELRKALERLGQGKFFESLNILPFSDSSSDESMYSEKTIKEISKAAFDMGKVKTGALIVIEKTQRMGDCERTGIAIDGIVTSQLLINIFEHNTPLHDGAVLIRGNRIVAATCYLPLSENMNIGKELGTRHRAGVGISEVSDSITVIVSEETGRVSIAQRGRLTRCESRDQLIEELSVLYEDKRDTDSGTDNLFKKWKGLLRNERGTKEE